MGSMVLGDGNFSVTPLIKVDISPLKLHSSKEQSRLIAVEGARILIIVLPLLIEKEASGGGLVPFYYYIFYGKGDKVHCGIDSKSVLISYYLL